MVFVWDETWYMIWHNTVDHIISCCIALDHITSHCIMFTCVHIPLRLPYFYLYVCVHVYVYLYLYIYIYITYCRDHMILH